MPDVRKILPTLRPVDVGTRVAVLRWDAIGQRRTVGSGVITRVDERHPVHGWVLRVLVRLDGGREVYLSASDPERSLSLEKLG